MDFIMVVKYENFQGRTTKKYHTYRIKPDPRSIIDIESSAVPVWKEIN